MTEARQRVNSGRAVIAVAATGTVVIALIAFWLSFNALRGLAVMAGIEAGQSWALPLIIDGLMVVATTAVFALEGARVVWYPWLLLIAAGIVSVIANCLHAVLSAADSIPTLLAASVASVAPVVHIACTHLTAVLIRHYRRLNAGSATEETAALEALMPPAELAEPPEIPVDVVPAEAELSDADEAEPVEPPEQGKPERREAAEMLSALDWSNKKIARALGVWPSTVGRWLPHPDEDEPAEAAVAIGGEASELENPVESHVDEVKEMTT